MIPKGGYGADPGTPFSLFRRAAELFERVQPRQTEKKAEAQQPELEEVAPGVRIDTKQAERVYDFDVFDVWDVHGDLLVLGGDTEETMAPSDTREFAAVLASQFGTELYPLLMDAMLMHGPDLLDRTKAVEYLRNIGEDTWAAYVEAQVSDEQWTELVSDMVNLMDLGDKVAGLSECYRRGYEYGSSPGAVELTAREIEERFPEVGVDAFAQGMIDGLQGDSWRLDQQTGQGDLLAKNGEWSNEDMDEDSLRENAMSDMDEDSLRENAMSDNDQPSPEDIVMYDSGPLGSRTSVGEVEGKFLGEFNSDAEAEDFIKRYMQQQNFWPQVWYQDDHGGFTRRSISLGAKQAVISEDPFPSIEKILESESIRLSDGRWTNGFVDLDELQQLIDMGRAEVFDNQGMRFVRKLGSKRIAQFEPTGTGVQARAARCWELMDGNERMAVRIGMSPLWTAQADLGGKAPGEGWPALVTADDHRLAAVALMQLAREQGGMIASIDPLQLDQIVGEYDESKPWGGQLSTHVVYEEGGLRDEDDIPEAWLMGATRGKLYDEAVKEWFRQKWMGEGKVTWSEKRAGVDEDARVLREFFKSNSPELGATPGYDQAIVRATGCPPEKAGAIEWLMRLDHPTLDSLTPQDFDRAAREAYLSYKYVMDPSIDYGAKKGSSVSGTDKGEQVAQGKVTQSVRQEHGYALTVEGEDGQTYSVYWWDESELEDPPKPGQRVGLYRSSLYPTEYEAVKAGKVGMSWPQVMDQAKAQG